MIHHKNLQLYLRPGLKLITVVKTIWWIQLTKKYRSRKKNDKGRKALYKLTNNVVYGKVMKNLINRIDIKLANNQQDYLIYQFHYDYIKNKYDNKSKLSFTDADSLMHKIRAKNAYEEFSSKKEMLDFSNYSTKSKYYDNSSKIVIWKMKDETGALQLKNFWTDAKNLFILSRKMWIWKRKLFEQKLTLNNKL